MYMHANVGVFGVVWFSFVCLFFKKVRKVEDFGEVT